MQCHTVSTGRVRTGPYRSTKAHYHITTLERDWRGGHFGELKRGDQTFLGGENRLREQNIHSVEMDQTIYWVYLCSIIDK